MLNLNSGIHTLKLRILLPPCAACLSHDSFVRFLWLFIALFNKTMLRYVWLLATPWPVAHQSPLSMEFLRQEYWCGVPFPTPGDLPNPGIVEPRLSYLLHWQADSIPPVSPGRPSTKQSLLQKSSLLACQSIITAKEETIGEANEGRMALGNILCVMQVTLQLRGWASAGSAPRKAMAFRSSGSSNPSEVQHFTTQNWRWCAGHLMLWGHLSLPWLWSPGLGNSWGQDRMGDTDRK